MGRRSGTETAFAILVALIEERTWEQSSLARRVGVSTRALRRALDELSTLRVPLVRDRENRSRVYWSVPKGWIPGGCTLTGDHVAECVRLLARLPKSARRDAILERLLGRTPDSSSKAVDNEDVLRVIEEAAEQRIAVRARYVSATGGAPRTRHLSVQRIVWGDRPRVVAVCHEAQRLKWFRADRFLRAELDRTAPFHRRTDEEVQAFVDGSFDGYRSDTSVRCVFFVRNPEARWVEGSLPPAPIVIQRYADGCSFTLDTNGLEVLARYLVGLGDAVRIVAPPALYQRVIQIASSALRTTPPSLRRAHVRTLRTARRA
jgi:predicted DNA-binding transcriptional regulator YafY